MKKITASRLIIVITAMLLLALAGIVYTRAYLTDFGPKKDNYLTIGNIDMQIQENFSPPGSLNVGQNQYVKQVKVYNNGRNPGYARVLLEISNKDVEDLTQVSCDNGAHWYQLSDLKNHLPSGWVYISTGTLGGYYYYTQPIEPGQSTPYILTDVRTTFVNKTADTNYTINQTPRNYDIYVYCEGLQQMRLNGSSKHNNYQTAWSEFLTLK